MKRLISTITLIIFLFAAQTQPAFAIRSEQLAENRYHLRSGNGARAGGEAEQAARQLLRWAELTLKSEWGEAFSEPEQAELDKLKPPVWGDNLTPEVYRIIQPYLAPAPEYLPQHITIENIRNYYESHDYVDKKGIIVIYAIMNRANVVYDEKLKQLINIKSLMTSEWIDKGIAFMDAILENKDQEYIEKLKKIYCAGVEMIEDICDYEGRHQVQLIASISPIIKPLEIMRFFLMKLAYMPGEFDMMSIFARRVNIARFKRNIWLGRIITAKDDIMSSFSELEHAGIVQLLAELAVSPEDHSIIMLREAIDGHEVGEEMALAEACCHVAWNLKKQGVWDEFVKEVERRRGEIEVDEADGRVTFRITLPRALQVEEQEVDVDAVGERELETTL